MATQSRTKFNIKAEKIISDVAKLHITKRESKMRAYELKNGRQIVIQREDRHQLNIWTENIDLRDADLKANIKIYNVGKSRRASLQFRGSRLSTIHQAYLYKFKLNDIDEKAAVAQLTTLLDLYGKADPTNPTASAAEMTGTPHRQPIITYEDFLKQQERKSEIGIAGEEIAVQFEIARLRDECKCPSPADFVKRISIDDVGRGYDIESTYINHERSIEVKATTRETLGFFISKNERKVLQQLNSRAWIYMVSVNENGKGTVCQALQDPMGTIPESAFEPVQWRVDIGKNT